MKKISKINMYATYLGRQGNWDLFLSEHAIMRCDERALDPTEVSINISLFLDIIEEYNLINDIIEYSNKSDKKLIKEIGWRMQKKIQFRDDVNDTNFALAFYPDNREVHVVTCWSQLPNREFGIEKHTRIKRDHFAIILSENGLVAGTTGANAYNFELIKAIQIEKSDIELFKI